MDLSIWAASVVLIIRVVAPSSPARPATWAFSNPSSKCRLLFNVEPNVALELSVLMWAA
jgi:hypothetical protein